MSDNTPIDPEQMSAPFSAKVINLADISVRHGRSQRERGCRHHNLTYDMGERRIWCRSCEMTIEGFDAFMVLVRNYQLMISDYQRRKSDLDDAIKCNIRRIAARNLEKGWNSRRHVPACPHCARGLLPEDFQSRPALVSLDIERARRKKDRKD